MELSIDDAGRLKPGEDFVLAGCAGSACACACAAPAFYAADDFCEHASGQRGRVVHVRDAVVFVEVEVAQACGLIDAEPCLIGPAHRLAVAAHYAGGTYSLKNCEVRVALRQVAEWLQVHRGIEKFGLDLAYIRLANGDSVAHGHCGYGSGDLPDLGYDRLEAGCAVGKVGNGYGFLGYQHILDFKRHGHASRDCV